MSNIVYGVCCALSYWLGCALVGWPDHTSQIVILGGMAAVARWEARM